MQKSIRLVLLTGTLLLSLGACVTKVTEEHTASTESALVASLTALAKESNSQTLVYETREPSGTPVDRSAPGTEDIEILSIEVENNFPDSITFEVIATSNEPLRRVALYYRFQGQDSYNLEMVSFSPGDEVQASFTWDTERFTIAPSSPIYFYWELEDETGNLFASEEMLVYYDDLRFAWHEIKDDEIIVRWYEGDQEFGELVFNTARESLDQMKAATGAGLELPIFVLLYANRDDFASWHFYVEDWVGGQAFTSLGVTTQILNPRDPISWITDVIPHEIAHLFFYQQIHTNLSSWPKWMDEGFAQYFEFNSKSPALTRVERAARNGTLTPLRYLNGSFGHDPVEVRLAYDQSLSVVVFLLETWGETGLEALISEIRTGATISAALSEALGVTFEEFEAFWITWLGTPATPRSSPTMIPTFGVIGMPTRAPGATETPSP
ncbi:MAG: hypothetical protein IMY80_05055 [Chloroflexi bacterium]|nr:hypothetical protein [Chloroflexota bacterium]